MKHFKLSLLRARTEVVVRQTNSEDSTHDEIKFVRKKENCRLLCDENRCYSKLQTTIQEKNTEARGS